jgi:glycosyltransferase involved in cell wall biosynthesis
MKIGINASFLRKPETGIGQVTANFLEKLAEYGMQNIEYRKESQKSTFDIQHSTFILYAQEPTDIALPENFEVKTFLPRWWRRDDVPRQWLWERELAKRAVADGCDVFLSLYQSATIFPKSKIPALPAGRKNQTSSPRHIMVVHDIIPKLFPEYVGRLSQQWHWRAIERGIQKADRLVAVSQSTKNDSIQYLHIPEERLIVAYPGVAPVFHRNTEDAEVDAVLSRYGLERGYIYHGGGLEIRKNTRAVLEAYTLLRRQYTTEPCPSLVISGQIHAQTNRLATDVEGIADTLGLTEHVHILGRVPLEDLPALYRGAAVFVYPSLYEGLGLPPLEAFSQATPVIAARAASLPEVCGRAALFIDPRRPDAIALALERVLKEATLREELSREGQTRLQAFSYEYFTRVVMDQCLSL